MRYLFSLVALLALLSGTSYSQTFNFHRISAPTVNGDTSLISPTVTYGLLTNTSSSVQRFRIIRIVNSLPATWTSQMCLGMCFGPDVDTLYPYPISVIQMAAGESDTLSIDVFGHNIGTGTIILKAFNVSNPSVIQVDTFKVHLDAPSAIRENNGIVNGYELKQNYPNPFNPSTVINFSIPKSQRVSLKVYDILGNEVASLLDNRQLGAGNYDFTFDVNNYKLSTGIYIYRLITENFSDARKMVLTK
jgi:hypothetical protein